MAPLSRPVLLLVDEPDDGPLITVGLQSDGFANPMDAVSDATELVEYLTGHGRFVHRRVGRPLVVLVSIVPPALRHLDTIELASVREALRDTPVFIVTGSRHDEELVRACRPRVAGYLRTPIDMNALVDALRPPGFRWHLSETTR